MVRVRPEARDYGWFALLCVVTAILSPLPAYGVRTAGWDATTWLVTAMLAFMAIILAVGASQLATHGDLALDADGLRVRQGHFWSATWTSLRLDSLHVEPHLLDMSRGQTLVSLTLADGDSEVLFRLPSGANLKERPRVVAHRDWLVSVLSEAARHPEDVPRVLRAYTPGR
ncbi:MAG: hypothetical protein EP330_17625 [Deltaproteobacteria bacterium]|nr:MAG: hypothetical protein EP330_17625 [Deltaproteobacteria bacterium]